MYFVEFCRIRLELTLFETERLKYLYLLSVKCPGKEPAEYSNNFQANKVSQKTDIKKQLITENSFSTFKLSGQPAQKLLQDQL